MYKYAAFQCDLCKRTKKTPVNTQSLDILPRCTITSNCKGMLHQLLSVTDIARTPENPPEVTGLIDWTQRNVLFNHEQAASSSSWVIAHGLNGVPQVLCYVIREIDGVETYQSAIPLTTTHDFTAKTSTVTFSVTEQGVAQCIARTTTRASTGETVETPLTQLGISNGIVTIATLSEEDWVTLRFEFTTSISTKVTVDYPNLTAGADGTSPWSDVTHCVVNGKRYTIRSFNVSTPITEYISSGVIVSGSAMRLTTVNGVNVSPNQVLFLMAKSPYGISDKIKRSYVDAAAVSTTLPETVYSQGTLYTSEGVIRSTYPPIIQVQ